MADEKKWYESQTMRNALTGMLVSAVTLIAGITGKVFDVSAITNLIDQGWALVPLVLTLWTSFRSWQGRKNASTPIVSAADATKS